MTTATTNTEDADDATATTNIGANNDTSVTTKFVTTAATSIGDKDDATATTNIGGEDNTSAMTKIAIGGKDDSMPLLRRDASTFDDMPVKKLKKKGPNC